MHLRQDAAAAFAVVALLAGCTSDPAPAPERAPDPATARERARCIVSDAEGELIVHPGTLVLDDPARVEGLDLRRAVNLEIVETVAVAFSGRPDIQGVVTPYPPAKNAGIADSLADWDQRRPLLGLDVVPTDGPQAVLVALRLRDPARPGHLDGVRIELSTGTVPQALSWTQPVLVEPPGDLCTVTDVEATLEWVPPNEP